MSNPLPAEIPDSFFSDTSAGLPAPPSTSPPGGGWQPSKQMYWYDSIIDDMFAHPGTSLKDCAARLGRSPVTIGLIARSDLFKARYSQRREKFKDELDMRLVGKLAQVAETSLDLTIEVLNKKRDSVPLPLLEKIATGAMDRLGYGPSRSESAPVQVNVNTGQQVTVSPSALAEARARLRDAAERPVVIDSNPTPSLVAGPEAGVGEEE